MKKFVALMLTLCLLVSTFVMSVSAVSFPDVTSPDYDWAATEIEDMVSKGYIKGYPDATFRPAQPITKLEALILSARILGFTDSNNEFFKTLAGDLYEDALSDYDFDYKGEVSYLLYKGVLTKADLPDYIAPEVINTPLSRYEAAVILSLVCGAQDGLTSSFELEFEDISDAPNWTLPYIGYVYKSGLMKGVSDTEFAPKSSVTRAQISVMLYRAIDALDLSIDIGTITKVTASSYALSYQNTSGKTVDVTLSKNTDIVIDGIHGRKMNELYDSLPVAVISSGDNITAVESISPEIDGEVVGTISKIEKTSPLKLTLRVDGKDVAYDVSSSVNVTVDKKDSAYSELVVSQLVACALAGDLIVKIDAEATNKTVDGTVEKISYEPVLTFTITDSDGVSQTFAADEEVTVKRNNKTGTLRDVLVGDKVKVVIRNNLMYSVTATGKRDTVEGVIVGINISSTPSIDVKVSGETVTYALNQETTYTLAGSDATIYDLRLNANVKLSLDSDTVVSVTASAIGSDVQLSGEITDIVISYNFITITDDEGATHQIFLSKDTAIVDAGGSTVRMSELAKGQKITVFGRYNTGVIEAGTIVVQ